MMSDRAKLWVCVKRKMDLNVTLYFEIMFFKINEITSTDLREIQILSCSKCIQFEK